jgi:Ca2+-binding RTX toxin-like protein
MELVEYCNLSHTSLIHNRTIPLQDLGEANSTLNITATPAFTFIGGAGNDGYFGGFGDTLFDGRGGIDVVDYTRVNQAVSLGARGVVNKGTAGVDQLVSIEQIIAPAGFANLIDGSTANGTSSSMVVNLATNSLTVNVSPTIALNLGIQNFVNVLGTSQDDAIVGNTADNILIGGAGRDILRGGGGFDLLAGGTGGDLFVLGDATQLDGLGNGYATITDWDAAADWIITGGNPNAYSLRFDNVSGGLSLDTIIFFGNDVVAVIEDATDVDIARDFRFVNSAGDIVFSGSSGNDTFIGGLGDTVFNGGSGNDTVDYSAFNRGISLGARGIVDKGAAGTDQLVNIERVIAPIGFANLIDDSTANGTNASFNVNLATNFLTVNVSPTFTLNLEIRNFLNVIGTAQNDVIVGNTADNILIGGAGRFNVNLATNFCAGAEASIASLAAQGLISLFWERARNWMV